MIKLSLILSLLILVSCEKDEIKINKLSPLEESLSKIVLTLDTPEPINVSSVSNYSLSGKCSEESEAVEISLEGSAYSIICTSQTWFLGPLNLTALLEGDVSVVLKHGLRENSSTLFKDTIIPTVTLSALSEINETNRSSYSLSGTCSDDERQVSVSVSGVVATKACSGNIWSVTGLNLTGLSDGPITVTANHTDLSLNPATEAVSSVLKVRSLLVWDLELIGDYTFDFNYVEVSAGVANLKTIDLLFNNSNFNNGNYSGTHIFSDKLQMIRKTDSTLAADQVLPSRAGNIIGYWKMETSGDDSSVNSNLATSFGDTVFSNNSKIGSYSASMDGASDYMVVSHNSNLEPASITISAWVYLKQGSDSYSVIVDKPSTSHTDPYYDYHFRFSGTNGASPSLDASFIVGSFGSADTASVENLGHMYDSWNHVAASYDGVDIKLYINGKLENTQNNPGAITYHAQDLYIGAFKNLAVGDFKGEIDEVVIWDTAITDSEVQSLYSAQALNYIELNNSWTPKWSDIVGHWKMDGDFKDSSGANNHANANGDTSFSNDAKVGRFSGNFDGVGDNITVSNDSSLNFSGSDFSTSVWVKLASGTSLATTSDFYTIFSKGQWGNPLHMLFLRGGSYNGITFRPSSGSSSYLDTKPTSDKSSMFLDNKWHHISTVVEAGNCYVFIDGLLVASRSSCTFNSDNTRSLNIGSIDGNSGNFPGQIDDFAIWKKALSSGDIYTIYNRQKQKYAASYTSPIIDMGTASRVNSLAWNTDYPFLKGLTATNESQTNYVSLVNNTLADGLIGLWHFDEASLSGASGEHKDSSGNGAHATGHSSAAPIIGKMGRAVQRSTAYNDIQVSDSNLPDLNDAITISGWVKGKNPNGGYGCFFSKGLNPGFQIDGPGDSSYIRTRIDTSAGINQTRNLGAYTTLLDGTWHHFTYMLSSGAGKFFVDGKLQTSFTYNHGTGFDNSNTFALACGGYTRGVTLDEYALWSRALTDLEVAENYRRGAARLKVQLRSCADASCSAKEAWHGPANNNEEYFFSEINNCSHYNGDGTCDYVSGIVNTILPNYTLSDFTNFVMLPDRYFQYRVLMESEESSDDPILPVLNSINFGTKYYGGKPTVVTDIGQIYTYLRSFSATSSGTCTPKFQLGHNSTSNWYYWNGSNWVSAVDTPSNVNEANDTATISTNIPQFSTDVGAGTLYVRAFLDSDTDQSCEIDSMSVSGY